MGRQPRLGTSTANRIWGSKLPQPIAIPVRVGAILPTFRLRRIRSVTRGCSFCMMYHDHHQVSRRNHTTCFAGHGGGLCNGGPRTYSKTDDFFSANHRSLSQLPAQLNATIFCLYSFIVLAILEMLRQLHTSMLLIASLLLGAVYADVTTTVDPKTTWGTWEGWGVSLAWWAKAFGDRTDLASAFFSTALTEVDGNILPGLGFNIVRYNAGACSYNTVNGSSMVVSSKILKSRQMDGYWLDGASSDPTSSSWTWTVDANQRNMLQLAQKNGADIFELFSNSPMWWMCVNHNPSGSNLGVTDNIAASNYGEHAIYLATIAKYAKDNWGVEFTSVDAFNEPSSPLWIGSIGTQEACHIGAPAQAAIIPHLRSELDSRGLQNTTISASDENNCDFAIASWVALGDSARTQVGRINVHGYGYEYGGGNRAGLYDTAALSGKPLWNTEFGDSDGTGKGLLQNLMQDMYSLHPTAWVYWQAIDIGGWGLIDGDNDAVTLGSPQKKYYVLAQFSRHVKPGMVILSGGNAQTVAAYCSSSKKLVVVAANFFGAQNLTFDLSKFATPSSPGTLVRRWSTQTNGTNSYAAFNDTMISGTQFASYFQQNEVQTFVVTGVEI